MSPNEVKTTLEKALSGSTVQVKDLTGGGDHFQVVVVSAAFEGKGLIDRHQLVYAALRELLGNDLIHALSLKTYTPDQWKQMKSK